ncbi:MAG: cupin domain-containing protein [Candidatus Bathyarchaeota archaeon]|jgi:quercetin dioxygenase-like cupin family protein|nr:MAG: cupin domain-containing protein [Candidatus Bathyarchaeota archaeon]
MVFKAVHYSQIAEGEVAECGAEGTKVRWLITKDDGAENFAMRIFEMNPGGHSPHHSHKWEHEVFILSGECVVVCENERKKTGPGYAIFIPPNAMHHFRNEGSEVLKFLCLVPLHK